jgi:GGDEF domain-containing protein
MGIMTSGYRCVSVISVVAGEVLALSRTHLDHLRRVYPRTAARLYANLSSILTEKLIQADQCLSRSCRLDEDTGLLNREALLECVDREIQRSQRFGEPMTFCLLKIQNHHAGPLSNPLDEERFLRQIARIAAISFRNIDSLGRFDSSTLVAVLSHTTEESARVIRRRLKAAFNRRYRLDKEIEASIWCRILSLDGQLAGNAFDTAAFIRSALAQDQGRLLYPSEQAALE